MFDSIWKGLMGLAKALWNLESKLFYAVVRLCRGEYSVKITDIQVLHESPVFLVVNKHHDVVMNRDDDHFELSLERQLEHLYPDLVNKKLRFGFYYPHRLDYATSGIVCVAKNKLACGAAGLAFSQRNTEKNYLAILRGHVSETFVTMDQGIGRDIREKYNSIRMAMQGTENCSDKTRPALTHLAVLERGVCYGYPATKVLLRPITGRRHQLRVHCSSLGHTIVGDYTYSNHKDVRPYRMFLHAYKLYLKSSLETLDVTAQDPFTAQLARNQWQPSETVLTIHDALHHLSFK